MGNKMYFVYKILSESKQPISGEVILRYLECCGYSMNIKTVYRLIDRLNEFYFLYTGKNLIKMIRGVGYIIENEFFNDGQLQLLMDSVNSNTNLDKNSAKELTDKLSLLSNVRQLERLNVEESNNESNYNSLLSLTTIIKAINNHKNIAFKYISYDVIDNKLLEVYHKNGNQNNETYIVSPYKLILNGNNYYLIGYFNKRKDSLSVYRVDRMRFVINHNSEYEDIRDQFDMEKEFDKNVNMYLSNEKIDLKIIFDKKVLKEVINQFGKDIFVCKRFDGRLEGLIKNAIFVSATPGDYELDQTHGEIVEQIIRPTGLLDPEVEVRPIEGQIDDLVDEIKERIERHERTLITTLTVRMAEDLTSYLKNMDLKVAWLHHEVTTIERTEIIHDLRQGKYDVLVGINLLREGLDIPEVSLIAILDADKEGFLRSRRSLIQIIGRAARNAKGKVIMYADKITESMQEAMDETARRRSIQMEYNEKHGIVPKTIIKPIHDVVRSKETKEMAAKYLKKKKLPAKQKEKMIKELEQEMKEAARTLDFERAAQLRDILFEMKGEK